MPNLPIIRDSDGEVVNVIVAEPGHPVPAGHTLGAEGGNVGDIWDGNAYTTPFDTNLKPKVMKEAWQYVEELQETLTVTVSVDGTEYQYGCDTFTQSNLNAIATAIANNVAPATITFTPKGELTGVNHTHAEFLTVASTVMSKVDSIIKQYLAHKAAIMKLADDVATIEAYDVTTGWPT